MEPYEEGLQMLRQYNDIFAYVLNHLLFNGEQVVKADELTDEPPRPLQDVDMIMQNERRFVKYWNKDGICRQFHVFFTM